MPDLRHIILPQEFHDFLVEGNITELFHANTLVTSCTYLSHRNIMSRKYVLDKKLKQTSQDSDGIDIEYGIWDHIFLDSVDISARSGYPNEYGPILFKISIEMLLDTNVSSVMVTRLNPTKWKGLTNDERYMTKENYKSVFNYGTFDHMITLQTQTGAIPLETYLMEVKIDGINLALTDPILESFSYCRGALRYAMGDNGSYNFSFTKRLCGPSIVHGYNIAGIDEITKRFKAAL